MRTIFRLGMEDPASLDFACNDKDLDDFFRNEWKAHHDPATCREAARKGPQFFTDA